MKVNQDESISDVYKSARLFFDKRDFAVFKENGREYHAKNINRKVLTGFQVDDGIIKSKEKQKCDKALLVGEEKLYLIELKGADIGTACEQLLSTFEFLLEDFKCYEY